MTEPRRSRRTVLRAGMAASALLLTGPAALAGCASSAPPAPEAPDPLERPARRAEQDVTLAEAVATAYPALAAAAGALAADRQAHATALRAEIRRVRPTPTPTPASSSAPPPVPVAATRQTAARGELVDAVRTAQDEAAALVPSLPGYRAALLASVAACCASHAAVLA